MTDTAHDPVDLLVDAARARLTRAAAAVPPDFAAVLARAQSLGDEAGESLPPVVDDDAALEEHAEVVDIRGRSRGSDADDAVVDGLVADARESVDRMVEQRRMRAIPPMPRPATEPARPRRWLVAVGAVGLAAAAVALFVGTGWVDAMRRDRQTPPTQQSVDLEATDPAGGEASWTTTTPSTPRTTTPRGAAPPPTVAPEPEVVAPVAPVAVAERPAPAAAKLDDADLRALSDEARRLWQAGDRRGAEAKFVQVTTAGRRSQLAELAWGDLFAIARQLGDDAKLAKRWRSYLSRFPRGRYADDARAGLCRVDAKRSAACWSDYLDDFPRGSYRVEAKAGGGL